MLSVAILKPGTNGAFHLGKISGLKIPETFQIKWKGFPAIELHLQSYCSHEPNIQQNGCCNTAGTLR